MYVYLSPHHDDVCFSVGHLAGRQGGDLINVFTRSLYVAAGMTLPADRLARIETVTALRRAEDMNFARAAGLTRHDLELSEPPVLGLAPFDTSGIDAEVEEVSDRLVPYLLELSRDATGESPNVLYCPMAIGSHRNHVSILLAIRRAYEILSRRFAIFLYEDLHYASNPGVRRKGLAQARTLFAGKSLSPVIVSLDPRAAAAKLRWIAFYASQHAHTPMMADFTPASGANAAPHEMIWLVSPGDAPQA